jgi:hypothetical protein
MAAEHGSTNCTLETHDRDGVAVWVDIRQTNEISIVAQRVLKPVNTVHGDKAVHADDRRTVDGYVSGLAHDLLHYRYD